MGAAVVMVVSAVDQGQEEEWKKTTNPPALY